MEIVCINLSTWELLKRQISRIVFENATLKALYCIIPVTAEWIRQIYIVP